MKKLSLLIVLLCSFSTAFAQTDFLDYVILKKDTIYGTIREIGPSDFALVLPPPVQEVKKTPFVSLRGASEIRRNDKVYTYSASKDPIYASAKLPKGMVELKFGRFTALEPQLPDYILQKDTDTIFQKEKIGHNKINGVAIDQNILSYRSNNQTYVRSSGTNEFLQLLIDGNARLMFKRKEQSPYKQIYLDRYRSNDIVYLVEIDGKATEIAAENFPDAAIQAFSDNSALVELIQNRAFAFENMYLITKFYNQTK